MDRVRKNNKESGAVAIHRQIPAIKMMVVTAVIMIAIAGLCFAGPSIADNDNENNENVILVYGFDKLAEALTPENNGKTVKLMGEEDTYVNYFYRLAPYGFPVIRLSVPADNIEWGMTIDLNGYHVNPATTKTDDQFFVNSKFLSIEHGVSITIKDSSKDKSAILMNGRSEGAFEDFGGIIYNDGNLTIEDVTFRGGYSEVESTTMNAGPLPSGMPHSPSARPKIKEARYTTRDRPSSKAVRSPAMPLGSTVLRYTMKARSRSAKPS